MEQQQIQTSPEAVPVGETPVQSVVIVETRHQTDLFNDAVPTHEVVQVEQEIQVSKNPIKQLYKQAFLFGVGRWLFAMAAFALATVAVTTHETGGLLLTSLILTIACGGLHVPLVGPITKPISSKNARPPNWYIAILLVSTICWAFSISLIFTVLGDKDQYAAVGLEKRDVANVIGLGTGALSMLDNLTIASGCVGLGALICCVLQWIMVFQLLCGVFREDTIAEAFGLADATNNVDEHS